MPIIPAKQLKVSDLPKSFLEAAHKAAEARLQEMESEVDFIGSKTVRECTEFAELVALEIFKAMAERQVTFSWVDRLSEGD